MSAETSAWAKEQICGDRTVKAVLREIANWARPDGVVEFLSVKRIASVVEVSPRTVQRAIAQLEEATLDHPDRLGLIRRLDRFREDGGQGACGFMLLGYQPPIGIAPRDILSPPHDMGVTLPRDKMSGAPVTPVSPLKRDKILTPTEPIGSVAPTAKITKTVGVDDAMQDCGEPTDSDVSAKPQRLPSDWQAPAIEALSDVARGLAMKWPDGAYQAVVEQFRLHWAAATGRTARKSNWRAAFGKWIITEHDRIMRAAKAGTSFAPVLAEARPVAPEVPRPVAAQAGEDERSAQVRDVLRGLLGARVYSKWLRDAAITFDAGGAVVTFGSEFQRSYVATSLSPQIAWALAQLWPDHVPPLRLAAERERAA